MTTAARAERPRRPARPDPLAGRRVLWTPFPGMQTRALAATETEVLLGGAKGPGKSDLLLVGALRQVGQPRYKALITRETGPQLQELIDRSHRLFPQLPEKPAWNGSERRWRFPSTDGDTFIEFTPVGTLAEVQRVQGREWSYIGYDEVGNLPDERVWSMLLAELRSPNPNIVRMMRGSANPGFAGHAWIKRRFIIPCGEDGRRIVRVRVKVGELEAVITRRFIPGTVLDNPIYAQDPLYMAQLLTLPEVLRRQLLFGDWNAGMGAALDELDARVHFVRPFPVPEHWPRFGGYDYGYTHPWVYVHLAADEDGRLYVLDTVRGRKQLVPQQAERMWSIANFAHPRYVGTSSDAFPFQKREYVAGKDQTPTFAEQFAAHGIHLNELHIGRAQSLNHLRYHLAWKGLGPDGTDALPNLVFFDTPGNRWLFAQLESMIVDPDYPEDVLKVDADPQTGEGGDDGYDALRIAVASRPPRAIGTWLDQPVGAFDPATLHYMREQLYRDRELPDRASRVSGVYGYTAGRVG